VNKYLKSRSNNILLFVIVFTGILTRFYKLDWGDGFFFHPDEYHIIGAVGKLINEGLFANPKLFSYGSFTVYLIYAVRSILIHIFNIPDPNLFIIGRSLAAFFSTLTLVNIYLISKRVFLKNVNFPLYVSLVAAFVPGLIQQAHYLTPESFMTFWITLSAYFLIKYSEKLRLSHLALTAMCVGVAGGTKVSSFAVLPFVLTMVFFSNIKKSGIFKNLQRAILFLTIIFVFFFVTFPYAILDYENFKGTTRYESSLSMGDIKVFYTRSFENTLPFIFQLTKIYPYILGIVLMVFSIIGSVIAVLKISKYGFRHFYYFLYRLRLKWSEFRQIKIPGARTAPVYRNEKYIYNLLILAGYFLSYFIFNSLLYTKWTRFVHPTIPFFIILSFVGISEIVGRFKDSTLKNRFGTIFSYAVIVPSIVTGVMFFSIYVRPDVRTTSTEWVKNNVAVNSILLTETGNTLEVPLIGSYTKIPFDFYNLDTNPELLYKFVNDIQKSDYFIIQSRRIYKNHKYSEFPIVYNFYNALFSGKLGFEEVAAFNSYPELKIGNYKLEIPDEVAEETWTVFDHPVIKIYRKIKSYPNNYYVELLRR